MPYLNKEKHTIYMKEWRKNNREKSLEQTRLSQRRFYHWNKALRQLRKIDCALFQY